MSESAPSTETLIEDFEGDTAHNESESTADNYVGNLKLFRQWLLENRDKRLVDAEKRDIRAYLRELKSDNLGNKTIHARYTGVCEFYKWLVSEGIVDDDPTATLESGVDASKTRKQEALRSDTPPAVTPEEKEKLCDSVSDPTVRNELMIRLMFQTGIREKELRNIRIRDLDRDERSIKIEGAKSGNIRTVYYNDLDMLLTAWLDGGRRASMRPANDSPYLFITNRSEQLARSRPNKVVKQAAENAGIQETLYQDSSGKERKRITCHALRHGFARACVKDGMDISFLKELMGHENLDTTKIYLKFTDDDLRDAVRKHGPRPQNG
jgi:integrase/recombinase XerD